MQLFYIVYIDWLNLENSWDNYLNNKVVVRKKILAICKAIRMAVAHFIQLTKEIENLSLIQNLVNWLAKRYNLDVN